ncbi:MAG: thioredoxin domain-containing protein [Deltaproteobacteria bacterium]|nr:thioredoxin domain-containing protein [Deltaproteobacteria bacterium]
MNRLAREPSPYLRQHAGNPVDWYPWGEEALARARAEDKPILLSVGYSACHWCHVMAHESFEDAATSALMNAHFVNVKVDREERPDLDQVYQGVVQLQGRGGGWPLTVFLRPDLTPFFGGTYFPPTDKHGLPGFPRLISALADAWTNRRAEVDAQAGEFLEGLAHLSTHGLGGAEGRLSGEDVVVAARTLAGEVDGTHGGFGRAPKFPNPMNVSLLLRGWRRSGDGALRDAALLALQKMAEGGLYDQLGGGFHRYSVDEAWEVPHFEKMLYDNGQLLHLYAEGFLVEPRAAFRKVVQETVGWLRREMTSPEGAFFAAQDADSEGEEGKHFAWTPAEVEQGVGAADAPLLCAHLGVTQAGNFELGSSVLKVARSAAALAREAGLSEAQVQERLDAGRARLFAARQARVAPGRDDKVLAGWNGLVLRGLAFASRVFSEPAWAGDAARAADFLLSALWRDGRLHRSWQAGEARLAGCLEDYGDLASGLCHLYQATFEPRYLEAARALALRAVELFWDGEKGAYLSAERGRADLVTPAYALHDNAFPSGASTLTEAQVMLAALTGEAGFLEQAERYLSRVHAPVRRVPAAYGHLWLAADAALDGAPSVAVVGPRAEAAGLLAVLDRGFHPTVCASWHDGASPVPGVLAGALEGKRWRGGSPEAFLCLRFGCGPPSSSRGALAASLAASGV